MSCNRPSSATIGIQRARSTDRRVGDGWHERPVIAATSHTVIGIAATAHPLNHRVSVSNRLPLEERILKAPPLYAESDRATQRAVRVASRSLRLQRRNDRLNVALLSNQQTVAVPVEDEFGFGLEALGHIATACTDRGISHLYMHWWLYDGRVPERATGDVFAKISRVPCRASALDVVARCSYGPRLLLSLPKQVAILVTAEEHAVFAGPQRWVEMALNQTLAVAWAHWHAFVDGAEEPFRSYYAATGAYYAQWQVRAEG